MTRFALLSSMASATVILQGASTWALHIRDSDSIPPLQTLDMALQFDSNHRYVLPVTMGAGDNPQHFNFTLSTGTGMTYVASSGCGDCSNTALYNKTLSSSAVSVSGSDNTTFFGRSVTGSLLKENCGAKLSNGSFWAYPNQTVILVDQQSPNSVIGDGISGILGLGTNRAPAGQTTNSSFGLSDSIYGQWLARNPTRGNFSFGMALTPPPSPSSGAAGQSAGVLHWLKPDEAFYKPDQVSWVDAVGADAATDSADGANTTPGQDWSVGLDGWVATIGDTHLVNSQSVVAVIDPMYPNIYLPTTQAKLIHGGINGSAEAPSSLSTLGSASQAFTIPCDTQYSFGLVVGSQTFVVSPDTLIIKQSDGTCVSAIEAFTDTTENKYLVGARFISTVYLIFNIPANGTSTLGFSPRNTPASHSSHVGAIVGGVVGGVAGVVFLGLLAWWLIRRTARNRAGPFLIEDAEQYNFKPMQQTGVEPFMLAPTPAPDRAPAPTLMTTTTTPSQQGQHTPVSPATSQPLLFGEGEEQMDTGAPPPTYEEASSSSGASPVTPNPPRDGKGGRQARESALSGSTTHAL